MKTYEQTIAASSKVDWPGGFQFLLLDCTSPVDITFYGHAKKVLDVSEGMEAGLTVDFRENGFQSVSVYSDVTQVVKIGINTIAEAQYNKLPDLVLSSPGSLNTHADVSVPISTLTQLMAANTNRREAFVQHVSGPALVRVGDSNIQTNRGILLGTGDSILISTTAALYCYHAGGSAAVVAVAETE